jgi:hypothetical protein
MRGHTHAQLLTADDGHAYVTKYVNNPLGVRVLVAEWIGAQLLNCVGLPAPKTALVCAGKLCPDVPEGLHIGSRYPGDPSSTAVYDFLPDCLFERVRDWRRLVAGVVAFDIWVANTEVRQTIFARATGALQPYFIDNTHLFGGSDWSFATTSATGTLVSPSARSSALQESDFSPWIARFQRCNDALRHICDSVPGEWLTTQDQPDIDRVFVILQDRVSKLQEIVDMHVRVQAREAQTTPRRCR